MKKPITWVHPDPKQPRKYIIDSEVKDLAGTLKTEGLIHPIEVDPNGKIVVGERRWRAMKKVGWKTLEEGKQFIINDRKMTPYERLRRQIIENIHHSSLSGGASTMDAEDEGKAFRAMVDMKIADEAIKENPAIRVIHTELGIPERTIRNALDFIKEDDEVKNSTRKKGKKKGIGKSLFLDANKLKDVKKRGQLKQWILKGKVVTVSIVREMVDRANTYPEKSLQEILNDIKRDADRRKAIEESTAKARRVLDATSNAIQVLGENPLSEVSESEKEKNTVMTYVKLLKESCEKYLRGDVIEGTAVEK